MKVRTPVGLNLTHSPSGMVLSDACTQGRWDPDVVDAALVDLLLYCADAQELGDAADRLRQRVSCSPGSAAATIRSLVASGLLLDDAANPLAPSRETVRRWTDRGWAEALYFHARSNLLPKTDYSEPEAYAEDAATMRHKVAAEPALPSNYKDVPGAASIPLARGWAPPAADLAALLEESTLPATGRPLAYDELSWIVHLGFGQTGSKRLPVSGEHVVKTSPSGGSRHPTELYVVTLDVESQPPGLYHFSVRNDALELLRPGDHRAFLAEHVFNSPQRPPFAARVVFLLSTVFERSMFRYREPRSYRVMQFDLGHLMQTAAYVAAAAERPCYRAYSLHDGATEQFLGIDGFGESVMAYMVLG